MVEAFSRDRRSDENRLTELFATTIVANAELGTRLLACAGLPSGSQIEASTMVWTGDGLQNVDMEVRAIDGRGRVIARLWSEHKVDSILGPTQAEDYRAALARTDDGARLIVIVNESQALKDAQAGGVDGLTWQEVGDWADELGRSWGGDDWRQKALLPDQPGKWRMLDEFLWHLEEEITVVTPLDPILVRGFKDSARAEEMLFVAARELLCVRLLRGSHATVAA
jgi:hypothetical protein